MVDQRCFLSLECTEKICERKPISFVLILSAVNWHSRCLFYVCAKPINKLWRGKHTHSLPKSIQTLSSDSTRHTLCRDAMQHTPLIMMAWLICSVVFILLYEKHKYVQWTKNILTFKCFGLGIQFFFAISTVFLTLKLCAVMISTKEL